MVLAYYGYGYGYDPTWILLVITGIIAVVAQIRVSSSFAKYSKVESRTGLTGAEAAERILHSKGIYDVRIQHIAGSLTDNYNPTDKTLNLSDATYNSRSVAAIGVAAHECGHAIQHDEGYSFLRFRTMLFLWLAVFVHTYTAWTLLRFIQRAYRCRYYTLFVCGAFPDCDASGRV